MKIVIQRVRNASVQVGEEIVSSIQNGMLILMGTEAADDQEDIDWLCKKIVGLRIFDDADKLPNLSIIEVGGDILVVSQFTLHASTKKGNRLSYMKASPAAIAESMYNKFIKTLEKNFGKKIATGRFGADMLVSLANDGPLTIIIDSRQRD